MKNNIKFINNDVSFNYIALCRHHDEELGLVIKGHLLIELVINKLLDKKFKRAKIILEDNHSFTFSSKIKILYSSGVLPTYLYQNITFINKLRNSLAHSLQLDSEKIQFNFRKSDGTTIIIKKDPNKRFPERHKIKMFCNGTIVQLQNHYYTETGEFPKLNV